VTAALAASAAALPAPAQAAQSGRAGAAGLAPAQALVTARINGRLETLNALRLAVNSAAHMDGADKTTLRDLITNDIDGLTSLRGKVAGETTVAAVHADATSMVNDYRVYLLVVPKVRLTDVFDTEAAAETRLQKVHDALSARLAKQGGGTSAEKAELADLESQIQAAQQADSGAVAKLLAIRPSPDASALRSALQPLVSEARTARRDLLKARTDAKELRAVLKRG
jgi:hypothetical protein